MEQALDENLGEGLEDAFMLWMHMLGLGFQSQEPLLA
jgi:hypothetical protein